MHSRGAHETGQLVALFLSFRRRASFTLLASLPANPPLAKHVHVQHAALAPLAHFTNMRERDAFSVHVRLNSMILRRYYTYIRTRECVSAHELLLSQAEL